MIPPTVATQPLRCIVFAAMHGGNGIDLAAVYQLLTEMAGTLAAHDRRFDQLAAVANEHGRKIDDLATGLRELRLAIMQYHDSVIGHGVELTRLDERVKRIEAHLNLDAVHP